MHSGSLPVGGGAFRQERGPTGMPGSGAEGLLPRVQRADPPLLPGAPALLSLEVLCGPCMPLCSGNAGPQGMKPCVYLMTLTSLR